MFVAERNGIALPNIGYFDTRQPSLGFETRWSPSVKTAQITGSNGVDDFSFNWQCGEFRSLRDLG
jgi:hypothetical protein